MFARYLMNNRSLEEDYGGLRPSVSWRDQGMFLITVGRDYSSEGEKE
jgi:hypothetical protein